MLTALVVRNLVVVREVEIEFGPGLTVLTGETGAGKSVLIEALGLALGERADSSLIRAGAERAEVAASFDLGGCDAALALLREQALDEGEECQLRRVLSRDGRSRAYCNGSPVTLAVLRDLAALLVDIHAQHAGQRLLQREVQRQLLDHYGALENECRAVHEAWQAWRSTRDTLAAFEREGGDRARLELLRYQVEELEAARLDAGELETIDDEYRRLATAGASLELCAGLRHALDDDEGGATTLLGRAAANARELRRNAGDGANLEEALNQAAAAVDEALRELDRLEDGLRADPERQAALDARLSELHGLARKHHVDLGELVALQSRLCAELDAHARREADGAGLLERLAGKREAFICAADALSAARRTAASAMAADISTRLHELGIAGAVFEVRFSASSAEDPQPYGHDRVEFTVATNPDQGAGPIGKIASGGELSRIGLAIQAATARHTGVPVVVYDEVDTGIGGTTANVVGRNLREVAQHCQVICITHSPQVASAGDAHVLVDKRSADGHTETTLRSLDRKAREAEIARMLGAAKATRSSLAHARDLLQQSSGG